MRKAGLAAGNMWRFIREMNEGDLVVVPHDSNFYVAKVTDRATYDEANIDSDFKMRIDVMLSGSTTELKFRVGTQGQHLSQE